MTLKLIPGGNLKPSTKRGKSPHGGPLVQLATRLINAAQAKAIEHGIATTMEDKALMCASYAAGLRDALLLLERAAEELNGRPQL